jgi:hypothetical protein
MVLMLICACKAPEPRKINVPDDVAEVIEPFLREMQAGNRAKAAAFVAYGALDEFNAQYSTDQKKLSVVPPLTARFIKIPHLGDPGYQYGLHEANVVYAVRKGEKWTTASIRLNRDDNSPYKIEYIRITHNMPSPALYNGTAQQTMKLRKDVFLWVMGAGALLGLIGLIFIFWLIKRRTHLIVPEIAPEYRAAAVTTREKGDNR